MKTLQVILVDDHPPVRDGLKASLLSDRDIELAAEAGDGTELLDLLSRIDVDVVVMDISLPDYTGLELVQIITDRYPAISVLVMSMYNKIDYILDALARGARGYMTKESSSIRLAEAVRRISAGEYYFDQVALEELIRRAQEHGQSVVTIENEVYQQLTAREREVMRLLALGNSVKRVAHCLSISHRTVENHRTKLYKKLHLENDAELVHYAARIGLIEIG